MELWITDRPVSNPGSCHYTPVRLSVGLIYTIYTFYTIYTIYTITIRRRRRRRRREQSNVMQCPA